MRTARAVSESEIFGIGCPVSSWFLESVDVTQYDAVLKGGSFFTHLSLHPHQSNVFVSPASSSAVVLMS